MVVTRRAPVQPPASRTASSQPLPRVKERIPQNPNNTPDVSSPLANGSHKDGTPQELEVPQDFQNDELNTSPSKKGKAKSKSKQKKRGKRSSRALLSLVELLSRIFLLWFTIYSLSVCPSDEELKSPVCRGIHEYRRLVIPYILPPIQRALEHPSVAPYVERAKPYADRFVQTATPIALRTQAEVNNRIIPQWNKHVVPQWNKRVIPLWNKHAMPHIRRTEERLKPYVSKVQDEYERRVAPHARLAVYQLRRWQHQAHPYIVMAAHKTYDGYQTAKPYAIPLYHKLKQIMAQAASFVAEQRRQFVDPHVSKIWERVLELSSGKPRTASTSSQSSHAHSFQTQASVASKVEEAVSSIIASSVHPDDSSATPVSVVTKAAVVGSASAVPLETASHGEPVPVVVTESASSSPITTTTAEADAAQTDGEVQYTASPLVVAPVAPSASPAVPSLTDDEASPSALFSADDTESLTSSVTASASSLRDAVSSSEPTHASATDEASSFGSADGSATATSSLSASPSSAPSAFASAIPSREQNAEEDIDLDAFYAELGLDGDELPSEPSDTESARAPVQTESEEEQAERRRLKELETAQKRADIVGRHANWEVEIKKQASKSEKALRKALVALRKGAVAGLKENKEIRREIESLVEDAEKFLKGAEKYLGNLKGENRKEDEKRVLWDKVIEKIDKRFGEKLEQTEAVVNAWYMQVLNQEIGEVRKVADEVRDVADRGQADIGLDYAWLDDVTYKDWQRYHDLVRSSENFTELASKIQDGSHPSPPANPVLPALADLQSEVQDVVVGFETRLRRVKRNGDRAFGGAADDAEGHNDDGSSSQPPSSSSASDPTVSILPIRDDEASSPTVDIPQVVIGRNRDEVLEALDRAAAQENPDSQAKSAAVEEVVESLASEAKAEDAAETSTPTPPHEEL